jgi:hypothetical protein
MRLAAYLDQRANQRPFVPVRRAFVELMDEVVRRDKPVPPLAELVRGGRGGSVRLRLLLSMPWIGSAPPHDVTMPGRVWATLLGLEDPEGAGARRVADAVRWLQKRGYIEVLSNTGKPNTLRLLSEAGAREPYELPGAAYNRLRDQPGEANAHLYVRLPSALWTSGWMSVLSPPAVAMLLVLFVQVGRAAGSQADFTTPVWIAPSYAKDKFALSEETRGRGLRELQRAGLVTVQRRELDPSDFLSVRRYRNVYQLVPAKFDERAVIPPEVRADPEIAAVTTRAGRQGDSTPVP